MLTYPDRKYLFSKVGAGDYLLPSNDGLTVWRISRYTDGPSAGITDWPRDRDFWGVWRWTGGSEFVDVTDWDRWTLWDEMHRTRRDAVRAALR